MYEILFWVTLTILIIVVLISIFVSIRALKKIEIYERWISDCKSGILQTYMNMRMIDNMGAFEADDMVGSTFRELKRLIDELSQSTIEELSATKELTDAEKISVIKQSNV